MTLAAVADQHRAVALVTWPVTVGASVAFLGRSTGAPAVPTTKSWRAPRRPPSDNVAREHQACGRS
jgi:hypothetical protein